METELTCCAGWPRSQQGSLLRTTTSEIQMNRSMIANDLLKVDEKPLWRYVRGASQFLARPPFSEGIHMISPRDPKANLRFSSEFPPELQESEMRPYMRLPELLLILQGTLRLTAVQALQRFDWAEGSPSWDTTIQNLAFDNDEYAQLFKWVKAKLPPCEQQCLEVIVPGSPPGKDIRGFSWVSGGGNQRTTRAWRPCRRRW